MPARYSIVFLSPNGSTERVAKAFVRGSSEAGLSISPTNLADRHATTELLDSIADEGTTCLFLGSPVYFNKAVPPIMAFIESLPPSHGSWAVPFVTYGRACSGVALWQMATALRKRGYKIAGAAKVLAVHSLMWKSEAPAGKGHPDESELEQIQAYSKTLMDRLRGNASEELGLDALDYQPEGLSSEIKGTIGHPWPLMPKTVDPEICTECGTCAEECPVDTITLAPLPVFGASCIGCFNCVSQCPEEAISPETPLEEIGARVRKRVKNINETPGTQVFSPADT